MTEGQKPDDKAEIEGILADLEAILSEKAPEKDKGKPRTEPGIANIIAGLGDALKQAQSQGVPPPTSATPPPTSTPAQPASKPPVTASPFEIKLDMPARSPIPPAPAAPQSKPPAAGPPPAPTRPTSPANPPPAKPRPLSPHAPPAPVSQQPPAGQVPPSPGTIPAPAAIPPDSFSVIPEEAPKDQIRRVAFLYSAGQKMPLVDFIRFVDSLALHFSKKPLYLRKVYLAELSPDNDLNAVAEKINAAGAVGVVGVLPGIHENKVRSLETGLTAAGISYYWLTPEEAFKRPVVLGLVVELMLLNAE